MDGLYPEWDEFYLLVCDICGIIIRPQALEKHVAKKHQKDIRPEPQIQNAQLANKSSASSRPNNLANNSNSTIKQRSNLNSTSTNSSTNDNTTISRYTNGKSYTSTVAPTGKTANGTSCLSYANGNHHHQHHHHIQNVANNINDTTTTTTHVNDISTTQANYNRLSMRIPASKHWGGKHALESIPQPAIRHRPCDWGKVRRAPDADLAEAAALSASASFTTAFSPPQQLFKANNVALISQHSAQTTTTTTTIASSDSTITTNSAPATPSNLSKYQDGKWRKTFNVLRDAFF